jgi:hypothetical protein
MHRAKNRTEKGPFGMRSLLLRFGRNALISSVNSMAPAIGIF